MSQPNEGGDFALVSHALGGLPIINNVLDRLGLPALLAGALPSEDARQKLAPAATVALVVTNLVLGREPLYCLGEWAARFDPGLLGWPQPTSEYSTTTGSGGPWRPCSTPTGPAC